MPAWFCLDTVGTDPCYDTSRVTVQEQSVATYAQIGGKPVPMLIQCNKRVYTIVLNGETYTHYYRKDSAADVICDVELGIRR